MFYLLKKAVLTLCHLLVVSHLENEHHLFIFVWDSYITHSATCLLWLFSLPDAGIGVLEGCVNQSAPGTLKGLPIFTALKNTTPYHLVGLYSEKNSIFSQILH